VTELGDKALVNMLCYTLNQAPFVAVENLNHIFLWDYDAALVEKEVLGFLKEC